MLSFISEVTRVSGRRTGVGSLGLLKRTGKNRDRDLDHVMNATSGQLG